MLNFNNKNILIMGFAESGQSALKLLKKFDSIFFIYDKNFLVKKLKNNKNYNKKPKNNLKLSKKINFFNNFFEIPIKNINICILSPGISYYSKEVEKLKKLNIKIISELELGALFCKGKIFAVTGTNGKTTTVSLLHKIFVNAGKESFLCGNVGKAISSIANRTTQNSFIVCEVSSFQLEATKNFKPFASAILNITNDHLDRHGTIIKYAQEKNKINAFFKSIKFFNSDNKETKKLAQNFFNSKYFSIKQPRVSEELFRYIKNNTKLIGDYNLSNILCAVNLAKTANICDDIIKKTVRTFVGLPHRLQLVAKHKNISFVNDSKATNPASTIMAINAVKNNIILMLGGSDKNLNFDNIFKHKIFAVIAYGETKHQIEKFYLKHSFNISNFFVEKNFKSAFLRATNLAKIQTASVCVLLSPACASFDEFKSYHHRGETFVNLVQNFIENQK